MSDQPSREDLESFMEAMQRVKAVLKGKMAKPGGVNCTFPHCTCSLPWTKCEKGE